MSARKPLLLVALLALVALYGAWFARDAQWVALVVFALPALLLALLVAARRVQAGFWSGVLALLWFSHGVMVAWTRPPERVFAWLEIVLALCIVFAASIPGMRARFGKRRASR